MNNRFKLFLAVVSLVLLVFVMWGAAHNGNFAVLNPMGEIAVQQKGLLVTAVLLSALVVIPVFVMTFIIVWKYRVGKKGAYTPNWDHNRRAEIIWWGIPLVLIIILSVMIWVSSHKLDPYRPLESTKQPLTVQVVALDWKWLFLYPDQNVATVNTLYIPTDRPINFQITADAPMNSLWIPQLGGQVYAMSGMSTQLHLMADTPGIYDGKTANISGKGYAGMRFKTYAVSQANFDSWVKKTAAVTTKLDAAAYQELVKPSENNKPATYGSFDTGLYDTVVMKYMMPAGSGTSKIEEDHDSMHQH